jgi:hypothetical protein
MHAQYAMQVVAAMDEEEWKMEAATAITDGGARGVLRRDRIQMLADNISDLPKA